MAPVSLLEDSRRERNSAFRRIWDRVSAVGRVVAIELPGFGHSDGRPELIAPDTWGRSWPV